MYITRRARSVFLNSILSNNMFFVCYFSLGIANQEQRSLAQRCELWKKSSQEKDLVCERAEKDKAVLSEKIQVRRRIIT